MAEIPSDLDAVFEALANEHRREIVYVLGLQPYSISQLAEMRDLSLPAIHKHLAVLDRANLIVRRKIGRTNILTLNFKAIAVLQRWLGQYQTHWGSEKASLDNYEQSLKEEKRKRQ